MDQQQQTPAVDETQITASIDALVKAAQATTLNKSDGVNTANSGGVSDGKPSGGGQGSMSDTGSIDDLTIGKMTAAGVDAGTIANFRAFMEEETKKKKGQEGTGTPPYPPFTNKSGNASAGPSPLVKGILEDPSISEHIDASPFMDALVTRTTSAIDTLEKSLATVQRSAALATQQRDAQFRAMAAALVDTSKMVKSQAGIIRVLGERLGLVERAPVQPPKGATQANGMRAPAQPLNKSGGQGQEGRELKKSQVLSTLSYMNLEKGIRDIRGQRTTQVIGMLEGGDVIDPDTMHEVQRFLSANPNEAELALSYQ